VGAWGHFLISGSKESNSELLSMFQCRDILASANPQSPADPHVDDEILGARYQPSARLQIGCPKDRSL
jgi:hypothetical protein